MVTTDLIGISNEPCDLCGNIMRFNSFKLGAYWTCSPCYYNMSKEQRDDLKSEVRDWDLIRKDRDYLD
jgi:hypothetical protein